MLRFLIGLSLLVCAIALPLHAPARGEHSAADNGLPDRHQQLEEVRKRLQNIFHQQMQELTKRERVSEKMRSLAEAGATFVFEAVVGLGLHMEREKAACVVGEAGKIYMYDFTKDGAMQLAWPMGASS